MLVVLVYIHVPSPFFCQDGFGLVHRPQHLAQDVAQPFPVTTNQSAFWCWI